MKTRGFYYGKARELNIGFGDDRVITIAGNGGLMWIWTFPHNMSVTSKKTSRAVLFPEPNLSNKEKIKVGKSRGGLHLEKKVETQLTSGGNIRLTLYK